MNYTPNFNDPRVIKRLKTAYGFTAGAVPLTEPKTWSQSHINKHFGQQQHKLSAWLRDILLICKDSSYNVDKHISKKYIRNGIGCYYIQQVLNNTTTLDYTSWLNVNDYNLIDVKQDEFIKINSYHTAIDKCIVEHFIEQEYGEELRSGNFNYTDQSHRRWHGIQSIRKEHKEPLLASYGYNHHYDISTCAPTIILNLALAKNIDTNKIQTIIEYIDNKTFIRSELAKHLNLPLKSVKILLNALFCGARIGVGSRFQLSKLFNNNRATAKRVRSNKWISNLRNEIAECWKLIEQDLTTRYKPVIDKDGNPVIDYSTGEIKMRKLPLDCRTKWDVYFTNERKILNSVIAYMNETNNTCFTEHDGWCSFNKIDLVELTAKIKSDTNLEIVIDYKLINGNEADASLLVADAPSISLLSNHKKEHIISPIKPLVYNKSENNYNGNEITITHKTRKTRSDASGLTQAEKQRAYRLRKQQVGI
jgi:hypothetical protein